VAVRLEAELADRLEAQVADPGMSQVMAVAGAPSQDWSYAECCFSGCGVRSSGIASLQGAKISKVKVKVKQ
jgi:hypothetical protein